MLAGMNGFPEPRILRAGAVGLAVYEAGEASARPPVVLVHGWPEIAYSWKNQMRPLAEAGFRAIAIDLKGFGRSDAPSDKALYDIRRLTDDLAALLDALGLDRAVFCGHDWGGAIVWPMAQLHPDRVAGVIGVSTPHRAPPPVSPLAIIEKRLTANHYFIRFQKEGFAESVFEGREEEFFRFVFRTPVPREVWPKLVPGAYDLITRFEERRPVDANRIVMSADDLAVYVAAYKRSGFTGGINLYRNIDRNYEIMRAVDPIIRRPALFVGADLDLFLPPEGAADMPALIPDLEKHLIAGCGHWVMWEKPGELNALMIDWLQRRFG
ncbi:MAG: alpha/beta hydrolase [Parvularculaceae bacterium]|jgi:microsomal epoxide hydrolase/non-specific protein-tyrosine kinase|nr:alpha/beta hydrolase [Parvularculaceae bacterium]